MPDPMIALPRGVLRNAKAGAATIVSEIVTHMKNTLTADGKSFSSTALEEWQPKLQHSVFVRLLNGGDWPSEKANVLAVAGDMAHISAIISGSSATVNKARVHASFRAVKEHQACPGGLGSGRWCDFDI